MNTPPLVLGLAWKKGWWRGLDARAWGFKLSTRRLADNAWVLEVAGELDLHTAPKFEAALFELTRPGGGKFVVDLSEVTFLDSTALSILLAPGRRVPSLDGYLIVVCNNEYLLKLFSLVDLRRVLTIAEEIGHERVQARDLRPGAR